jgi:hypothetical protein
VSRNQRIIIGVIVVLALVGGGIALAGVGNGGASKSGEVIILSKVQRRTLESTVALNGTLARKEIRNVTAASEGLVSAVYSTAGSTTQTGEKMFSLNGRVAIAEPGTLPFFRELVPGDMGNDVVELKQILAAAGDYPGPMDSLFTNQTQFALAQWQAQHGYPNSTPATQESVDVTLEEGTGYKLGAQDSSGLLIGPPTAQTTSFTAAGGAHDVLAAYRSRIDPLSTPLLTIQSVDAVVSEGEPATFVITASQTSASDITVNLDSGGTADSNDIVTPPSSVTLPAGSTSTTVTVQTRVDNVVKPTKTLILSIAGGSGYTVGSSSSAQTSITNNNVPTLQITGGTSVSPGGSATLTVTANQAPLQNTQVDLTFSGSAVPGTDYDPVNPVLVLDAGSTSATVTVTTLNSNVIQPSRYIVASLTPSPSSYSVGSPGSAVITINGATGSAALPTVTLSSATTYLEKGEPYEVEIGLSEALSSPLTINLSYGGSAAQGVDYSVPSGSIVVPPGQTALQVTIPTVTDNLVEADRVLTVSLAPSSSYQIGSPSSASVDITSAVVPELNISSNTSTVPQGGAASFVITANQPPVKATSVNFTVEGTAQPGENYEPLSGSALLQVGQTSVTVVLQSLQNDVVFDPTDMIIGQWPTRIGQVFVKAGQPVTPGGPILSLTQQNLTVTLQASASDRTQLKVGQSCTVQIEGDQNESSGTIVELDSTPTSIDSGTPGGASQQVYEGKIDVPGLNGADGAAVSINVVDQQVNNALTVPIAAVKQNGSGDDVVRVINLAAGGRITEVPVKTGLTEGSYIQITRGLVAGQTVIDEVDQPQ